VSGREERRRMERGRMEKGEWRGEPQVRDEERR
jgi:hypothetical protein